KLEQIQDNQKLKDVFQGDASKEPEDKAIYERVLENILEELRTQSYQDIAEYRKKLEALANLYAKGYDINWILLHQGEAHQKINLPTYPFLKERYWISETNTNRV